MSGQVAIKELVLPPLKKNSKERKGEKRRERERERVREREREREKEREKGREGKRETQRHGCERKTSIVGLLQAPDPLGIKPETLGWVRQHSNQLGHLARAGFASFCPLKMKDPDCSTQIPPFYLLFQFVPDANLFSYGFSFLKHC